MTRRRLLPLALLALFPACGKAKDKPAPAASGGGEVKGSLENAGDLVAAGKVAADKPLTKLEIEVPEKGVFVIKNAGGEPVEGRTLLYQGKYTITFKGVPKGTKWQAGDLSGTVDSDSYANVELMPLDDRMGSIALPTGTMGIIELDPGAKLILDFPKGPRGEVALPPVYANNALTDLLKKVEHGAVTFGTEPPDARPHENVVWVRSSDMQLFGRGKLMSDIDLIAIDENLPEAKGEKQCTGYKDSDNKPMPAIKLKLVETKVTIYDRRTGDVVTEKTFEPDASCPMFAFVSNDQNEMESSPPRTKIEAWLKTQFKR